MGTAIPVCGCHGISMGVGKVAKRFRNKEKKWKNGLAGENNLRVMLKCGSAQRNQPRVREDGCIK